MGIYRVIFNFISVTAQCLQPLLSETISARDDLLRDKLESKKVAKEKERGTGNRKKEKKKDVSFAFHGEI